MKFIMGPAPCMACGTLLFLYQYGTGWDRLIVWLEKDREVHRCPKNR